MTDSTLTAALTSLCAAVTLIPRTTASVSNPRTKPATTFWSKNAGVRSTCNALKFGTASFIGFKNIICRDLEIYDTYISAIALELVDGGTMENVQISRVKITDCNNAIFLRLGHRNEKGPVGSFRNVTISDVTAEIPNRRHEMMNKFPTAWRHHCTTLVTASITGLPENPVCNVTLKNISIVYGGIGSTPKTARAASGKTRRDSRTGRTLSRVHHVWCFAGVGFLLSPCGWCQF